MELDGEFAAVRPGVPVERGGVHVHHTAGKAAG